MKFSIFVTKRTVQVIEVYKSTGSTILNGHSAGSANVIKWHWFHATIANRLNRHGRIMISRLRCKYPALRAAVCKNREIAVKTEIKKFFIFSQKKTFGETFSKLSIKVSKEFSFSRKPAKSEMLPHAI